MAVRCPKIISGGTGPITGLISNEIPSGTINGVNTDFTLANNPVEGTVEVFLNGLLQVPGTGGDYTISGKVITFAKAPCVDSDILANYAKE